MASKRTRGRPPKGPAKYQRVTITMPPDELERLEALRAKVSAGAPAPVARSDLARLAFSRLLEQTPAAVRRALAERRQDV